MKTFLFVILLMPSVAWTQVTTASSSTVQPDQSNELGVRYIYADYKYEEPGLMQIAGKLSGIGLDYKLATSARQFVLFGGQYLSGTTYYDGTYLFTGERTPTMRERDFNYTLKLAYGMSVNTIGQNRIDFSAGWARRFHVNEGAQYDREQTYIYLPLEVAILFPMDSKSAIKLGIEQDIFLSGKNTTKVSQYYDENDRVYRQDSGKGSKLSLGYETSHLGPILVAQIYLRQWEVDDSSRVVASYKDGTVRTRNGRPLRFFEPENETKTLGFSLGSRF